MQIKINDEPINFSLDNEKTLGEVIEGLNKWLKDSGLIITSIKKDETDLPLNDSKKWNPTPLENIETIDVKVNLPGEIRLTNLQTLYQYFTILEKSLEHRNFSLIKELQDEYEHVEEVIDVLITNSNSSSENSSALRDLFKIIDKAETFSDEHGKSAEENISVALRMIRGWKTLLDERIREYNDPLSELLKVCKLFKRVIKDMEEVAVLLQAGRDKQAMELIIQFTELSQKLLRLYPALRERGSLDITNIEIEGKSFEEFYRDLNALLRELIEAFISEDYILIGDLLEYEIAPRVDKLLSYLRGE
ncbi:MAG: hypothetical protein DRP87_06410 [Spirochaetes bacterium]|nr:MAG: hypothetical protein DRP87_06410 [Spirochaetota bacterium]